MNKTRNNELISLADKKLKDSKTILKKDNIAETYDSKIAALSVSVAMYDLLPSLAIYYQDYDAKNPNAPCRRYVLDVVATMISIPNEATTFSDAKALLEYAINNPVKLKALKRDVIDCSIALKQVVRTYNLV